MKNKPHSPVTPKDIAWLAGLLEGEGCFFNLKKGFSPRVALAMTDEDVVRRASAMLGAPAVYARQPQKEKHKVQFWMMLTGHRAAGAMMTIYSFMGTRRKAKIREVLARWKAKPYKYRPSGLGVVTECDHVERRHYAHGLCRPCYVGRQERGEYKAVA